MRHYTWGRIEFFWSTTMCATILQIAFPCTSSFNFSMCGFFLKFSWMCGVHSTHKYNYSSLLRCNTKLCTKPSVGHHNVKTLFSFTFPRLPILLIVWALHQTIVILNCLFILYLICCVRYPLFTNQLWQILCALYFEQYRLSLQPFVTYPHSLFVYKCAKIRSYSNQQRYSCIHSFIQN